MYLNTISFGYCDTECAKTCANDQFLYHYKQINNCNYENNNETNGQYNDNIIGVEKTLCFYVHATTVIAHSVYCSSPTLGVFVC